MIRVRYFARFREELGLSEEEMVSDGIETVGDLLTRLRARGGDWSRLLGEGQRVLVAVNQEVATSAAPLSGGDEVAFFPPVTGG